VRVEPAAERRALNEGLADPPGRTPREAIREPVVLVDRVVEPGRVIRLARHLRRGDCMPPVGVHLRGVQAGGRRMSAPARGGYELDLAAFPLEDV